MINSPKLFISIGDLEIFLITGYDDQNSFELLELIPENYYELDLTAVDQSNNEIFSNIVGLLLLLKEKT